jgi:hypothetical protein
MTKAGRVDGNRSRMVKLAGAITFRGPSRQHVTIGAKLDDSRATLIDDIDRVIGTDGDPS